MPTTNLIAAQYNLNANQLLTWQQAYDWEQLPQPKYICYGRFPSTKEGKQFFAPFLQAGYIAKNELKFAGVFRLTDKGKAKFEELKAAL
jgi:hypothetical protein